MPNETLIYLNSASSAYLYPDNTHASFTVQLPTSLDLTNCSVALSELCFSSDFSTLARGSFVRLWGTESYASSVTFTPQTFEWQMEKLLNAFDKVQGTVIRFEQNGRIVLILPKAVTPRFVKSMKTKRLGEVSDYDKVANETLFAEIFETRYVQDPTHVAYEIIADVAIPAQRMQAVATIKTPDPTPAVLYTGPVNGLSDFAVPSGAPPNTHATTLLLTYATLDLTREYVFPHARIKSVKDAVDMLQTAFDRHQVKFEMGSSQMTITTKLVLELSQDVGLMLGWPGAVRLGPGQHTAPATFSLNFRSANIFVCCDIVEHMVMSDTYDRVLRSVALEVDKYGSQVYKAYDDGQYHKCNTGVINSITLQLRTDTGELLPLNPSPVATWVVLKLRDDERHYY